MPTNLAQNRFYQMHDAMAGGYLPDTQFVCTTKKAAKELARDQIAHNYRGDDNLKVLGNAEDGYEIVRKDGPFGEELHRVVDIHGPMTAEEMGYDDVAHLIEDKGWAWMKGASKHLE
jgi:hypothetical protein